MAGKQVNWTANALANIYDIQEYLESQAGKFVASEYVDVLLEFGNSLDVKSEYHSYCRHPKLQAQGYRCATFKKTYVLIYKESKQDVSILAVIHVKRSPDIFASVEQ
jgi:plasmid stabilization system protein ParE